MSARAAALGVALVLPWAAAADPTPATAEQAATAAKAATAEKAAAEEADAEEAVLRTLRRAEREGFEHHDIERYFSVFAPDAVWLIGRREVADEHDVRVDRATRRAQLERRYRAETTGHEQVFFRDIEVERAAGRLIVSATLRQVHFGGRDTMRLRYVLAEAGAGEWMVREVREWPLREVVQGMVTVYDDEHWLRLDEEADKALAGEEIEPTAKVIALVSARRLKQALDVARAAVERRPDDAEMWRQRAELAFSVGRLDESRSAAEKATALSPTTKLPLHLR